MIKDCENNIIDISFGDNPISKVYSGNSLVWEKTEQDYIQDGLFLHLDGADCAGSSWVDKVSGKVLSLSGSVPSVSNGGVVFNGASVYYNTTVTLPTFSAATIEVVAIHRVNDYTGRWIVGSNAGNQIWYTINTGAQQTSIRGASYTRRMSPAYNKLTTHSITTSYNIINKVSRGNGSNDSWGYGYCFSVGGKITNSSFGRDKACKSTVYQIRIYNRKLTQAEILYNQSIDIKKYNISV